MVEAYQLFWKNYVNFSGRSRRAHYWWVVLIQSVISVVAVILQTMLGMGDSAASVALVIGGIYSLYNLATVLPMLSLGVRRLHDTGRSGWWYLINFVPCIGSIVFLVFVCMPGTVGDNQFGPDPKASDWTVN